MLRDVLPSTPGIYASVNLANQHFYVGSAVNLRRWKMDHFKTLKAGTHRNAHLQHA
jgi:excinuclease UvrABC nuclease subunit